MYDTASEKLRKIGIMDKSYFNGTYTIGCFLDNQPL